MTAGDGVPRARLPRRHRRFSAHAPGFGPGNRPFVRARSSARHSIPGHVEVLRDGRWTRHGLFDDIRAHYGKGTRVLGTIDAGGWAPSQIAFDRRGHAYTMLRVRLRLPQAGGEPSPVRKLLLLCSRDAGETWRVHELDDADAFALELAAGPEPLPGPPSILLYEHTGQLPRFRGEPRWLGAVGRLRLVVADRTAQGLQLSDPVPISERAFGLPWHSGGGRVLVGQGSRVFVLWGESAADRDGTPIYIASYDRRARELSEPRHLLDARPPGDRHNGPAMVTDAAGRLHVVTGAHNGHLFHLHTIEPYDIGRWTEPVPLDTSSPVPDCPANTPGLSGGCQTYVALARTGEATLHVVYRQLRSEPRRHGGAKYPALVYQRRSPGEGWQTPKPLLVAPLPGYGIYYHKLNVDRNGWMHLSYSYYTNRRPYASLPRYEFRSLWLSKDGGQSWGLATTRDFVDGMQCAARAR